MIDTRDMAIDLVLATAMTQSTAGAAVAEDGNRTTVPGLTNCSAWIASASRISG